MELKWSAIILFIAVLTGGCKNNDECATVNVVPLHEMFYLVDRSGDNRAVVESLLVDYKDYTQAALLVNGFDTVDVESIEAISHTKPVEIFTPDVIARGPSMDFLNKQLNYIYDAARREPITLPDMRFATIVWGKPQSLIVCDSIVLIGLNHYLGADYAGYTGMDEYRRQNKTVQALPYDVAEMLVATKHPFIETDSTSVVNRLVYEGALIAAKMKLVDNAELHEALGYTPEQLREVEAHIDDIWRVLLTRQYLFDKDMTIAERLVNPAPSTPLISPDCPGRVGRYIGFMIVDEYLKKHREMSIDDVLSPNFYGRFNPLETMM